MGKFSLEKKIKDRLVGHKVHIDKNELWKGLGIEEEEKDRKAIWFWWVGGFIGIALIASLWWYSDNGTEITPEMQNSSLITVDESVSKTGNETIKDKATSEQLSEIIQNVKAENDLSENTDESSDIDNNTTPLVNNNSANIPEAPNSFSNQNTIKVEEDRLNASNIAIPINENAISINEPVINNNEKEAVSTSIDIAASLESITALTQSILPLNYQRELETLENEVSPFIKPIIQPKRFEFGLFAGAGTIQRDITSMEEDLDSYLSIRDTYESVIEHISAGFDFKYNIGNGFYTKVGLTMNRWNEKMVYSEFSDTTRSIKEVPDVILIDLAGNETVTYTEGETISYNWLAWTRYNRLTQFDLPVTLGFEQNMNRWSIFGEAAAIFNLKQKFSGYMYSEEKKIVKNPSFFKSNVGINLGLNIGLGYALTERITGRMSARYYRSLNSVLLQDTKLDQRYTSIGLRASISYLF